MFISLKSVHSIFLFLIYVCVFFYYLKPLELQNHYTLTNDTVFMIVLEKERKYNHLIVEHEKMNILIYIKHREEKESSKEP